MHHKNKHFCHKQDIQSPVNDDQSYWEYWKEWSGEADFNPEVGQ